MAKKAGTTVTEAAAQVFALEKTRHQPQSGNAAFERRFNNRERNPFLGWNPDPHWISSYHVFAAVLDGGFRGLFNANGFIRGTGYLLPDDFLATIDIDETRLVKESYDGTVIIGCNIAHGNYFHWVTQALPAISASLTRVGQDKRVALALPVLNSWQEESIKLLGYGDIKRIVIEDSAKQYAFAKIEFNEIINGGIAFCLSDIARRTYLNLRRAVEPIYPQGNEPTYPQGKKIYVARTDSPSRRMRNESALIEEIRKRGFEIVVPGDLTVSDQIDIFRSASLVVGPHGAGMTNIVFCNHGTTVYELLPSHYTNSCFCNLANICRLNYWADSFDSDGNGLPSIREWESDTRAVIERLREIEAINSVYIGRT